jgi:hypothetical protein
MIMQQQQQQQRRKPTTSTEAVVRVPPLHVIPKDIMQISDASNVIIIPPDEENPSNAVAATPRIVSPAEYLQSLLGLRSRAPPTRRPTHDLVQGYDMVAIQAIRDNNVAQLRALVESSSSCGCRRTLHACNRNGESLLHMACRRGSVPVIAYMLQEGGVDVTWTDDFGRSCLHDVCWRPTPHLELMELLLPYVPIELLLREDVRGHTPWEYCRKEHFPIWIQFLESHRETLLQRLEQTKMTTSTSIDHYPTDGPSHEASHSIA